MLLNLSNQQLGAVLAGLRVLQLHAAEDYPQPDILDVATNGHAFAPLTADEIDQLCESINTGDLMPAFGRAVSILARQQRQAEPELNGYIEAAREFHHDDGELEIDDDTIVSKGDDAGAYVLAWVWVTDDEVERVAHAL